MGGVINLRLTRVEDSCPAKKRKGKGKGVGGKEGKEGYRGGRKL